MIDWRRPPRPLHERRRVVTVECRACYGTGSEEIHSTAWDYKDRTCTNCGGGGYDTEIIDEDDEIGTGAPARALHSL